ncbi:hypothetical protein KEJ19_00085 [Candidatus Bathyarchaeota archaeon]|nr:hypothetical protein [Candidatus Bathyarchaeota archaeon]
MTTETEKTETITTIREPGSPDISYINGLTFRSFLALIYTGVVFLPASIWMTLALGNADIMWWTISYTTVLLFSEITRFFGTPLSKQELFIIWSCAAVSGATVSATGFIFNLYYRNVSSYTLTFTAPGTNIPLREVIPDWWAPPPTSTAVIERTLFHPDFRVPILLSYFSVAFGFLCDIGLGLLTYNLYVKIERLQFPLQRVSGEMVVTVATRESRKMSVMVIAAVVGLAYGTLAFAFPFATNFAIAPIPIPWAEIPIDAILPGATLGFATDLFVFATGFIIPFNVVVSIFIGSLGPYVIGNPILVYLFPPTPGRLGGLFGYASGMRIRDIWNMSMLRIWASPNIGVSLAAGLIPLALNWRRVWDILIGSLKALMRGGKGARFSLVPIVLWLGGVIPLTAIPIILVPGFPAWILILLGIGMPLISSIIAGRGIGETGYAISIPYVREGAYLVSGYQGIDIWYTSPPLGGGGAGICANLAVCDMTETSHRSWILAYIIAMAIALFLGFLYVEAFWRISPIPSSSYPATVIFWPIQVLNSVIWVSRSQISWVPENIIFAFVISSAATITCHFLKFPFSIIGFAAGFSQPIPQPLSLLVGGIINIFLTRKIGKGWTDYKIIAIAGLALGEGIAAAIGSIIALIRNAAWSLPY